MVNEQNKVWFEKKNPTRVFKYGISLNHENLFSFTVVLDLGRAFFFMKGKMWKIYFLSYCKNGSHTVYKLTQCHLISIWETHRRVSVHICRVKALPVVWQPVLKIFILPGYILDILEFRLNTYRLFFFFYLPTWWWN